MKKLVSVLLMLALVCGGAAAMAAEIPERLNDFEADGVTFNLMTSIGSCRVVYGKDHLQNTGDFRAQYYFTGELEQYKYKFDCGCTVTFNSFGDVGEEEHMISRDIPEKGGTFFWDIENEIWVKHDGSETCKPDNVNHAFDAKDHPAPLKLNGVQGKLPELDAAKVTELRDKVISTFISKNPDQVDGKILYDNGVYKLIEKDGMYAFYRKNEFVEAYVGSLVFNTFFEDMGKICRLYGDPDYGVNTIGHYDWETGELFEYQFYTADRMMNAVYSAKNVLLSYEVWDNAGAWWGFFDNEWEYAADGNPEHSKPATPDEKILEKILHAPAPATYESACVTSESQLKADQKGVPFIIGSKSDINNATVQTVAEQTGARSTEFDISLVNASGKKVDLAADSVTLTLGYPAGMPQDVSKNYEFAVVHKTADGTEEVMTTMTGDVKLTANGPQVTATGFSPYTVIWGTADELAEYAKKAAANAGAAVGAQNMPQTGDDSMILLWAALLGVSCMALVLRKRSRA